MRIRDIKRAIKENNDDLFASQLDRILSNFTFPEDGALGYMIGGGEGCFGNGHACEGVTIVNRVENEIAFIPDFTYFDEDPTQEDLEFLFYDEDPDAGVVRQPITRDVVMKVRSISEAEVELDEPPAPERKTQTKTKPQFNYDPFQQPQDQPLAQRPEPKQQGSTSAPNMRRASAARTQQATAGVRLPPEAMRHLDNLRNIEIDPDLAPYPDQEPRQDISTEVNTENLPAVAGEALQAAGVTSPEFHQVARLPGNMAAMIRQLGKKLFGSMTNTPTEEIYMVANLGGQGPNTRQEVNAVANFAHQNGEDMGLGDIDFNAIMPGYTAETHQFSAAGIRFLLVKDFAGQYVYCWPEADSKTPSSQAQLGNAPKRLSETDETDDDLFSSTGGFIRAILKAIYDQWQSQGFEKFQDEYEFSEWLQIVDCPPGMDCDRMCEIYWDIEDQDELDEIFNRAQNYIDALNRGQPGEVDYGPGYKGYRTF